MYMQNVNGSLCSAQQEITESGQVIPLDATKGDEREKLTSSHMLYGGVTS